MPELAKTILANSSNLKAYYRFESGALTTDSSGNSHTLTAVSDPAETTGVFGGGVALDTDDCYTIVNHADLRPTGNFSISAWINLNASGSNQAIFQSYSQNSNVAGILFVVRSTGVIDVTVGDNTGTSTPSDYVVATSTGTITDGVWTHVAVVRDGTTVRIYINGKADGSVAWSTAQGFAATNYVRVGCQNNDGTNINFLNGSIDDLALFNGTALSADQIKELYEGRIYGELRPNQFGTIQGLYHLSDTTDFSGNNNHLTNNGTTTFASGKFGNAADFGTSNSTKYLRVASAMSIDGGAITMGGWFKARAEIGSSSWIFCNQGNSNTKVTYRITYDYNSGTRRLQFSRVRQGVAADTANYTITLGTSDWYHLGLTYDGTTVKGYINGALVTSQASTGNGSGTTNSAFAIGSFEDGSGFASIYADEVFIASTALTANQIRQIYALGVGKYY